MKTSEDVMTLHDHGTPNKCRETFDLIWKKILSDVRNCGSLEVLIPKALINLVKTTTFPDNTESRKLVNDFFSKIGMIEKIKKNCSEGHINTNLYMRWDRMYHSCHKICVAINNMPNSKQYSLHFREVEIFGAKCCVFDIEQCNSGRNQPSCDQSPKTKKMRTDVHGTCCTSTPSDILSSGNAEEDVKGSLEAASVNSLSNAEKRRSLEDDGPRHAAQPNANFARGTSEDSIQNMGTDVHGTCCKTTPSGTLISGNAEEYVEGSLTAGSSIENTQDSTRGSNVKGTF